MTGLFNTLTRRFIVGTLAIHTLLACAVLAPFYVTANTGAPPLLITLAAYVLLATALTGLLGKQLTRPITRLKYAFGQIAAGDTPKPPNLTSNIQELDELAAAIEQMRTALVHQREALAVREARLSAIMDNVIDGLVTVDQQGTILSFNAAAERMFGYPSEETLHQPLDRLLTNPAIVHKFIAALSEDWREPTHCAETLGKRADGSTFHMEFDVSEICELDHRLFIVVCRDISERKEAELKIKALQEDLEQRVIKRTRELADLNKELQHQALHDALTELPNRVLLQDRLQQATRAAKRQGNALALMLMDLDRFKEINDTLGHHYGDLLLQQVAVRMRGQLRDSDTVARLGGDEFAVVLPNIQTDDQAAAAKKIIDAMDTHFILEGQRFQVGISIGIAMFPNHGENSLDLMRRADVAMYAAKRAQCGYLFYDASQDVHTINRLSLAGQLREALDANRLSTHYQPTIDLATKRIVGAEALVRWALPEKGYLPPEEFIPLAEYTGLIKPLTRSVLNDVFGYLNATSDKHPAGLKISINLSTHNLFDPEFIEDLANRITQHKIPANAIQMEVTERAIMEDPPRAIKALADLQTLGVELALDNFGAGFTSLMQLKQLPIHEIKIDQSFISSLTKNSQDEVIVTSTIDLAHKMGYRVVAKGVDNLETVELLMEMGCDLAQGFFIGDAMTADELTAWLSSSQHTPPLAEHTGGQVAAL